MDTFDDAEHGTETFYVLRRTYMKQVAGVMQDEYASNIMTVTSWHGVVWAVYAVYCHPDGNRIDTLDVPFLKFTTLDDAMKAVDRLAEFEPDKTKLPEIVKVVVEDDAVRESESAWKPEVAQKPDFCMDWLEREYRKM